MKKIVLPIVIMLFLGAACAHAQNESFNHFYDGIWTSAQGDTLEIVSSGNDVSCNLCLGGKGMASSHVLFSQDAIEVFFPSVNDNVVSCKCDGCRASALIEPTPDGGMNLSYVVLKQDAVNGIIEESVVYTCQILFSRSTSLYTHL